MFCFFFLTSLVSDAHVLLLYIFSIMAWNMDGNSGGYRAGDNTGLNTCYKLQNDTYDGYPHLIFNLQVTFLFIIYLH